jgi:sarcosine oxidase subunit gamma
MNDEFTMHEISAFTLYHVMTRGDCKAVAERLSKRLALDIPLTPNTTSTNSQHLKALWFGPGRWLVFSPVEQWCLDDIQDCAVTELSDSRRLFRLSGAKVRERLATGCPLNLSDTAMPPGSCAMTHFDQLPIVLCCDDNDRYELYVERSYCDDLLRALRYTYIPKPPAAPETK